jgi:EAL domain-containing protein (putative c-di-GMP-specific phosphodiesterase class I)
MRQPLAAMPEPILPYHERLPDLERELIDRGSIGVVVVDATALGEIEDKYGLDPYEDVRKRLFTILEEARGKDYRAGDLLCLDRPRGLRFLFFLDRKRRRIVPLSVADLKTASGRVTDSLVDKLAKAGHPYVKRARLQVGHGLALYNPLLHTDRMIERALEMAHAQAAHQQRSDELLELQQLEDVLLRGNVRTSYQPIMRIQGEQHTIMGYEALSRGPRASSFESAERLFDTARDHGLRVELDRLCRQRALLSSGRIPSNANIFVNTLPATLRDPQFRGKALIDFLDRAQVSPDRIVIEITEQEVVENYEMFRHTMANFTDLGMTFAVDDVGMGYSNFESIAKLKPSYLKIDMKLVRDVHASTVNTATVKAIVDLGHGIGAKVIGEGIQINEELQVLQQLKVDYGQGYYLARPDEPRDPT